MRDMKKFFLTSTIGRSLNTLSKRDTNRIAFVTVIQIGMSLLDLLGVALLGILGALAVNGIESKHQGKTVSNILRFFHISAFPLQKQALVVGALAAFFLVSKTLLSVFFSRRTAYFLSRRGAAISGEIASKLLGQPLLVIQSRTTQETLYALTVGVGSIMVGVIGVLISLISDSALLCVMILGLLVVDPLIALSTLIVFAFIGYILYFLMHKKAQNLGEEQAILNIKSNETILEVLDSYRESMVRNRRWFYSEKIKKLRLDMANNIAETSTLPNISKYVVESTVIVGSLTIGGFQFALKDATHAIATLTIFLAAGTRIAPAVLRVQQGLVSIKGSLGSAIPTLNLIESLQNVDPIKIASDRLNISHEGFQGKIEMNDVSMSYPGTEVVVVNNVSLCIDEGEFVALVGPSGGGKSTLVDILLGVLIPQSGHVEISNLNPLAAIDKWPGAIAYVPQQVSLANGTVEENIALGFDIETVDGSLIFEVIDQVALTSFIKGLPNGIKSEIGERGTKLSGGQKQRIGIARALLTHPKLLVLDEATSALDAETELHISQSLQSLRGKVTLMVVAHRLSTVRHADKVYYLENGAIRASGTFDEVRSAVPDFDNQAKLMGL